MGWGHSVQKKVDCDLQGRMSYNSAVVENGRDEAACGAGRTELTRREGGGGGGSTLVDDKA